MGISIFLAISKSVTVQEWAKVYEETLKFIDIFPFAEIREVSIRGIKTVCLTRAKETRSAKGKDVESRWSVHGDYITMHCAEDYHLSNKTIGRAWEADAGDAMFGMLPAYLNYDSSEPRFDHIYEIWGAKTQGEPYHMYLLAIACLIEARLGEKAFVYGDITRGQCKRAVEMLNEHLDKPIDMPDRCDIKRFFKRVSKLQLDEHEKLQVFTKLFLGVQDSDFGKTIKELFSAEACRKYWEERLKQHSIGSYWFEKVLHSYLLWGFDLETLCDLVDYGSVEESCQYEKFVKSIMDTKLYIREKDCTDVLDIDAEEEQPYGIFTQFTQFMLAGMRNKKVDRYIPISEIKDALCSKLAGKCNVEEIIDEYLDNEKRIQDMAITKEKLTEQEMDEIMDNDASYACNAYFNARKEERKQMYEEYDIADYEELILYKSGDTIQPELEKVLKNSFHFYHSLVEEDWYKELLAKAPRTRCKWLIEENRSLLLRDKDWEKIFIDIKNNQKAFARYYPMVRVRLNSDELEAMVRGIALNDDLYRYCMKLEEDFENNT